MVTCVTDMDEFEYFSNNFKRVYASQPELMNQILMNHFQPKHRDALKTILASKRILITPQKASDPRADEAMEDTMATPVGVIPRTRAGGISESVESVSSQR